MSDPLNAREVADEGWSKLARKRGDGQDRQPPPEFDANAPPPEDEPARLVCRPLTPRPITNIPPRPWAYGKFLLFGSAAAIGAVDGGGKGAHAVVIALSMITGRPLLGERVWRKGSVAIITYEDDETEWHRRIAAACLHYELDYENVIGQFHFISRLDSRVCLASRTLSGDVIFPDSLGIIEHLKTIGAVLLIIDPLNHAHNLEDGNILMAKVAGEVMRIAHESTCAALVLHHLRKGSTGDPDDLMGATSLRATFRAVRIFVRMTTKQAKELGLPERQSWRYSRIAGTKENYAPPPELTTWYKLKSIDLGNADELYTEGDNLQVATAWIPPSSFEGLSLSIIAEIFTALRVPPGLNLRWAPDPRSDEWAGKPISRITGKTSEQTQPIVRTWIKNAVLVEDTYEHPKHRRPRTCVALNETKAAEILAPLYFRPDADE